MKSTTSGITFSMTKSYISNCIDKCALIYVITVENSSVFSMFVQMLFYKKLMYQTISIYLVS